MKLARERHPGEVWKTPEGKWRSQNPAGDSKSFDTKDQADAYAKPKKDEPKKENDGPKGLKGMLSSFLEKAKKLTPVAKDALKQAPKEVQRLIVDKDHRKETTDKAVEMMKKGAKAIPTLLKNATKEEIHEIKHGVSAVKKVFKKPPEKLTGPDKKALYAVGVYVVAGTVMAATGGLGAMAGTLGNSFAKHVAFKAVNHILDQGFTHFEVGHSFLHGLHHFSDHLASERTASERVALRYVFGEDGPSDDELQEILLTYVYQAIHDVMADGLSDEDMQKVLEAANDKSDKSASFGSKVNVVKLANALASLVCDSVYKLKNRNVSLKWNDRTSVLEDSYNHIRINLDKWVLDALESTGTSSLSILTRHSDNPGNGKIHDGNNYYGDLSVEVWLSPKRSEGQAELASLLAHELMHSVQFSKQNADLPSGRDPVDDYALDPYEVQAHIREFVKRSKMTHTPLMTVVTDHWMNFFDPDVSKAEKVISFYAEKMRLKPH